MTTGIYKITNKETGQVYIGQSQNCERRIVEHKKRKNLTIDDYINFFGVDAFIFEIVEECQPEELDDKEKEYIKKYDSINNGYNYQEGGFNNSIGEGNGRAKLTEEEVKEIRVAYSQHKSPKEVYEKYKNKVSYNSFQGIWQGQSWSHIMPEVFTEENKKYYISGIVKDKASLTLDEVLRYRKYYVDHTAKETYNLMCEEKGEQYLKESTFKKILIGDVRDNSIYREIPVYKKSTKEWIKK